MKKIPNHFLCPFSGNVMTLPVIVNFPGSERGQTCDIHSVKNVDPKYFSIDLKTMNDFRKSPFYKVHEMGEQIKEDFSNHLKLIESGEIDDLLEDEKEYLFNIALEKNWKCIFDIPKNELNEHKKNFCFVCKLLKIDCRSYRHVVSHFKNNKVAMHHIGMLIKNENIKKHHHSIYGEKLQNM
jgi:hypothetical protein